MASLKLVLRTNKKKTDGTSPLYLRIIEDRKARFVSTGVYLSPRDWNEDRQEVRKSHLLQVRLNDDLKRLLHNAEAAALSSRVRKQGAETDAVLSEISGKTEGDVYAFCLAFAERLHNTGRFYSWKRVKVLVQKLKAFLGDKPLTFRDLDGAFLGRFERYMREKLKNRPNTIAKDHQVLRRVVSEAIRAKLMDMSENPYLGYKVTTEKTVKSKLTVEQIRALEELVLTPGSPLAVARDAFLFSFYSAGTRFGDLCQLSWANVSEDQDGKRIEYRMSKTGKPRSIKLFPQAQTILARYQTGTNRPHDLIFPILKPGRDYSDPIEVRRCISSRNVVVNKNLKRLASLAGITSHVSFHVSRHSFADYARRMGVSIYDIMQMLAHHSLKVTELYFADSDQTSMDREMDRMFAA
jgi:integrase/recombinase XerD